MSVTVTKLNEVDAKVVLGGSIKVIFTQETTNTRHLRFSVGYFKPGEGLAAHIHPESEEVYHVISGSGTVYIGEKLEPMKIEADTAIFIPPGTVHGVKNTGSDRLVVAFFVAPGKDTTKVV